jgi:hypothetical protein
MSRVWVRVWSKGMVIIRVRVWKRKGTGIIRVRVWGLLG